MGQGDWKLWEAAPAGRVPWPPGRWRDAGGSPLHGVWAKPEAGGGETVVVANHGHVLLGWRVPHHRWRFASELVRVSNCALARVSWVWRHHGRLLATHPGDVAVGLVLAGRKPAALAETADEALAGRWQQAASAAGLAVRARRTRPEGGIAAATRHVVHVAVPGRVGDHLDLDTLLADYRACLPAVAFCEVEQAVSDLRERELTEVLGDPGLTMTVTPAEHARTGIVLGYHPATTAGLILGNARTSMSADEDSALIYEVLARAAAPAPLPGLASNLRPERKQALMTLTSFT